MNKRFLFIFGVLLVVGMVFWLPPRQPLPPPSLQASPAVTPVSIAANDSWKKSAPLPEQAPSEPTPPGYGGLSDPRWREREKNLLKDDVYEWKKPINFYGRAIDENQLPVAGAKVHFEWSDTSPHGASSSQAVSDANGRFELIDKRGNGLTVRIAADGYYTPRKIDPARFENTRFWDIHYYEPDAKKPVLFQLRKRGVGEALSQGKIIPTIPADGTPVRFDLLHEGGVTPDGQLEIAAVTNAEMYPPRFFGWRATISVPGGGLIEHSSEFPFEAPEDGYQSRVEFNMPLGVPDWKRGLDKKYFIRFGTPPRFGQVHIRLDGDSQKVELTYAVNPSGSRNLETPAPAPSPSGN